MAILYGNTSGRINKINGGNKMKVYQEIKAPDVANVNLELYKEISKYGFTSTERGENLFSVTGMYNADSDQYILAVHKVNTDTFIGLLFIEEVNGNAQITAYNYDGVVNEFKEGLLANEEITEIPATGKRVEELINIIIASYDLYY